jgi:hypothetical protein
MMLLACGCSKSADPADAATQMDVVVMDSFTRPAAVSGVIAVYAGFTVGSQTVEPTTIFVPYLVKDQFLPIRGDRCRIDFQMRRVEGVAGSNGLALSHVPVADRFVCGSNSWRNPTMKWPNAKRPGGDR